MIPVFPCPFILLVGGCGARDLSSCKRGPGTSLGQHLAHPLHCPSRAAMGHLALQDPRGHGLCQKIPSSVQARRGTG